MTTDGTPGADEDAHRRFQAALAVAQAVDAAADTPIQPDWGALPFPVIDRGTIAIVPLAGVAVTASGDSAEERRFGALAYELWRHWGFVYGGHDFRVGRFDDEDAYGVKLTAAGAHGRSPFWWTVRDTTVVFVRSIDRDGAFDTLSLHLIPHFWVKYFSPTFAAKRELSHHRRGQADLRAADVSWSWDVSWS